MKSVTRSAILVVFVLALALGFAPSTAQANVITPPTIAAGSWNAGTETEIDLTAFPAPYTWFQLFAQGVTITEPGKICHEFRGGQFGWVADIRQLVDGKWVKAPTTQGWLNGEEAAYTVCVEAPTAGTYALFAYYIEPPAKDKNLPRCDGYEFGGYVENMEFDGGYTGLFLGSWPDGVDPATLTYKVLSYTPAWGVTSAKVTSKTGHFVPYYGPYYMAYPVYSVVLDSMVVRIYTPTCYVDWEFIWT
jgi:hypothetical protein